MPRVWQDIVNPFDVVAGVSFVAAGTFAEKATSASDTLDVQVPNGINAGDMLFLFVAGRGTLGSSITACAVSTPSGWTLANTGYGDDYGTNGTDWHWGSTVDTGCYRFYVFAKEADGTEDLTNVTVSVTDAHMLVGVVTAFRKEANNTGAWGSFPGLDPRNSKYVTMNPGDRTVDNYQLSTSTLNGFSGINLYEVNTSAPHTITGVWPGNLVVSFRCSPNSTTTPQFGTQAGTTKHFEGNSSLGSHLSIGVFSQKISSCSDTTTSGVNGTGHGGNRYDVVFVSLRQETTPSTTKVATFGYGDPVNNSLSDSYSLLAQVNRNFVDTYRVLDIKTNGKGRPVGDTLNSIWYPSTPGSELYAMLDETVADDGDYIYAMAIGSLAEMQLDSLQPPPPGSTHVLRVRLWSATGDGVRVILKQGPSTTIASWDATGLTNTPTLFTFTLTAGERDSISNYDQLRVRLQAI